MATRLSIIVVALFALATAASACVGDSSQPIDGGGNDASTDTSPDVTKSDGSTTCVFGASHFGDGCKFGP